MNLGQLKTKVAAYCNRDVASFVVNGFDVLTDAINQARRWAQLVHDFNYCRARGVFNVSFQTGGDITSLVAVGTTNPLDVKKIEGAYIQDPNNITYSYSGIPIKIYSRWVDKQRQTRLYRGGDPYSYPNGTTIPTLIQQPNDVQLIIQNTQAYLTPGVISAYQSLSSLNIILDVIAFQPDLVNDTDQDFFCNYCNPWLTQASINGLNVYLKEDERLQLQAAGLEKMWTAILAWDAALDGEDDGDLQ